MNEVLIWAISLASILAILFQPFRIPEWASAVAGALILLISGQVLPSDARYAVAKGADVYFFLIGMMFLSEQARAEGLFDWVASVATEHARGSAKRLFVLLYCIGIGVTVFLSNDATAVVLTPAVYAAVKKAGAKPLPYLFACAFIANAASFVLPISNPANLVVYGRKLPKVATWLGAYTLPSLASILATFVVLWIWFREPLSCQLNAHETAQKSLSRTGKMTAFGILGVIVVMITASSLGLDLGLPTFISAALIVSTVCLMKGEWPLCVAKNVSWGVVPMVAGLFVIVEAMNRAGALLYSENFLNWSNTLPAFFGKLSAAFGIGFVSNIVNNLPIGLIGGTAVQNVNVTDGITKAVLVGVDLGPNLSVTGSLATLLWLMALRREGEQIKGIDFLKVGMVAMPISLLWAILFLF